LEDVQREVQRHKAKTVFISSDKNFMLTDFHDLFNMTVGVRRLNKPDLYLNLAILSLSDHLIANCMSTYSGFAVRHRLYSSEPYKSVSFFGFDQTRISVDDPARRRDEL